MQNVGFLMTRLKFKISGVSATLLDAIRVPQTKGLLLLVSYQNDSDQHLESIFEPQHEKTNNVVSDQV